MKKREMNPDTGEPEPTFTSVGAKMYWKGDNPDPISTAVVKGVNRYKREHPEQFPGVKPDDVD